MADPWTERNWTQKGREQAAKEQEAKRAIRDALKKWGKLPVPVHDPTAPKTEPDAGYPKPKPFWEPG
jgi:hypothetical protein